MHSLINDIRSGIRNLAMRPAFSLVAGITLALGIGATTTIFSVVDAVLLRALPFNDAGQLAVLREVGANGVRMSFTEPNFQDLQANNKSFTALATSAGSFPLVVSSGSQTARVNVSLASSQFFAVMNVKPFAGRPFIAEEDKYHGPVAVVLSYGFWQKFLGGRSDFANARLNVDGVTCNVVGVMPADFDYPTSTEIWMTRNTDPPSTSRTVHNFPVIARLRPGVSLNQAQSELTAIARQLRQQFGQDTDAVDFVLIPLQTFIGRNVRQALWLFLGAGSLLLLMAWANYANLLLAQLSSRHREFTVRSALGASRWRIARQISIENLLVTVPASVCGAILAAFGVKLLLWLDDNTLPRVNAITVNARVLFFASGIALLIALVSGLLPALSLSRQPLQSGLKEAARGSLAVVPIKRWRDALVAAQVALTLLLLMAATLLGRSFLKLMWTDPGFKPDSALAMTLSLPTTITPEEDQQLRVFYVQLLEWIQDLPGITAVGGVNVLPLTGSGATGPFTIDNDSNQRGYAAYRVASAGYFAAMRIPLLSGRLFDRADTVNSPHAAVISKSLAEKYWPNQDPLGRQIQFANVDQDKHPLHVVGVVSDVRNSSLDHEAEPTVYAYSLQRPQWWQVARLAIVVRAQTDPESLIPALRTTLQSLKPDTPASFKTLNQVVSSSLDAHRFSLAIFGVFAITALLLAIAGVYGMMSYMVARRTHEIGIRMALGARSTDVRLLIIRNGMMPALVGTAIGIVGALVLTRLIRSLLFGVTPTDVLSLVAASLSLIVVALLASYLPARRATKVDPLVALRYE